MFKFPYNWLVRESEIPVEYDKLIQWLEEQGFEIASLVDLGNDKLIEIEVKANRPDMLSVAGVLREYYCACNEAKLKDYSMNLGFSFSEDNSVLGHKFIIESDDVHRYYGVGIKGIDNTVETPKEIVDVLTKLGIDSISPVVDISNYVMLLVGQPTHIFDSDKVCGNISIVNEKDEFKFTTISNSECVFPKGTLLIKDDEKPLCVAGIIGGHSVAIEKETQNIIIESANFDHIVERVASKKSHVTTLASYRYERGVSVENAKIGLDLVVSMIQEVCGGEVCYSAYEHNDNKQDEHTEHLSIKRTNSLLGVDLNGEEIASCLRRCFFEVENCGEDDLLVHVPPFRLDVDDQVDLIEEVGRIYGYHNIVPMPVKMGVQLAPNPINVASEKIRDIMIGTSGIECITYSFIPDNAMDILKIKNSSSRFYGDIQILNPLSNYYALMRPTLAYSLISTAIDNIKAGCKTVNIFELGRTFCRQKDYEYGYNQRNTLGGVLYGINQPKGFGIVKDNAFCIYDTIAAVNVVMSEYNVKYEIVKTDELGFLKKGTAGYIMLDSRVIGCVGVVNRDLLEHFGVEKIINFDMMYYEFDFDCISESKKVILHNYKYPSIKREYNFIVKNGIYFADYKKDIVSLNQCIVDVKATDVYRGKGIEKGFASVLLEIQYNDPTDIIGTNKVLEIESKMYDVLKEKYGISLKH